MATVGQQLTAPESGWRRYEDTDSRFIYSNGWNGYPAAAYSGGTVHYTTTLNAEINFKFYGSKIRVITSIDPTYSNNVAIFIDGVQFTFTTSIGTNNAILVYENTTLSQGIHVIRIVNLIAKQINFDAIDIDNTGYLVHPTLNQISDINSMQIGDCIPCRYTANTSGNTGGFSELGTCIANEIPITGTTTPDGLFYFIKTDKGTLIADRVIQTSISCDTLNAAKYIEKCTKPLSLRFIDGNTINGLNYYATYNATNPNLCVYNNNLYCTWYESNTAGTVERIRVKQWDGTSWTWIDGGSIGGLNYNNSYMAMNPNLCVYNGNLYCSWQELNSSSIYQIRVKKYDGTSWTFIDGNGINGLNYNTSVSTMYSNLCVYNNELYCTWMEQGGNYQQIRIKKYNGTTWTWVDGGTTTGINYNTSNSANNPYLCVYNGNLYCTWYEYNGIANQIRVKKYDGTSWTFIDGNVTRGLNFNYNYTVYNPQLCTYNSKLYCTWYESNSSGYSQIRVKQWDGTTWAWIDGGSTNGINYSTSSNAQYPNLYVYNGNLYCTWSENNSSWEIRVKMWNGTSWISSDNNSYLNYSTSRVACYPNVCVYNNIQHYCWQEVGGSSSNWQIRILKNEGYLNGSIRSLSGGVAYLDANGNSSNTDNSLGAWPSTNEWDSYIVKSTLNSKITAGDDNIWHWSPLFTQVKEIPIVSLYSSSYRCARGCTLLNKFSVRSQSNATDSLGGFRPVLEYLEPNSKATNLYY